jgi:hypothetical protein
MAKTLAGGLAVSIAALLFAGCGGGSSASEVAVDAVAAPDSTTMTIAETVPPSTEPVALEVPTTQAAPVTRSAQPSQTNPAIPPSPTTTACVPDQSRLAQLEDDRILDGVRAVGAALDEIFYSLDPSFGIEVDRVRRANINEWQRALAALNSCQITSWKFLGYPASWNYTTPTTSWWGTN